MAQNSILRRERSWVRPLLPACRATKLLSKMATSSWSCEMSNSFPEHRVAVNPGRTASSTLDVLFESAAGRCRISRATHKPPGPPTMVDGMTKILGDAKVKATEIRPEEFIGY